MVIFWSETSFFDPHRNPWLLTQTWHVPWRWWCIVYQPPPYRYPFRLIPILVPTFLAIQDRHRIRHLMVTNPVQMSHHHPDGISPSDTSKPVAWQAVNWTKVPSITLPVSMWLATHYNPSMIRLKKVTTGVPGASKRSYLSGKTKKQRIRKKIRSVKYMENRSFHGKTGGPHHNLSPPIPSWSLPKMMVPPFFVSGPQTLPSDHHPKLHPDTRLLFGLATFVWNPITMVWVMVSKSVFFTILALPVYIYI